MFLFFLFLTFISFCVIFFKTYLLFRINFARSMINAPKAAFAKYFKNYANIHQNKNKLKHMLMFEKTLSIPLTKFQLV